MPETKESARKWSGYVCPDCRFVFRVPRDHDGEGLVCPSCRRLLKIPRTGDVPPPLLAPVRSVEAAEPAPAAGEPGEAPRRRRSSKGRRSQEAHSWEAVPRRRHRSLKLERRHMAVALAAGAGALLLILAAVWASFRRENQEPSPQAAVPASSPAVSETRPKDEPGDRELLALAEPVARAFLAATRVEDILPLVRDGGTTAAERIRSLHPDGTIEAPGLNNFNVTSEMKRSGGIYQVVVETKDFEYRQMNFVRDGGRLLVDWDSWAGWSEMPWDGFLAEKPAGPKMFRVLLREADYYNFGFSDETKWRCYQLDSPGREVTVYGYAERGGPVDERLRARTGDKDAMFVLDLGFPPDGHSRNQVLIDRVVTDGWALAPDDQP